MQLMLLIGLLLVAGVVVARLVTVQASYNVVVGGTTVSRAVALTASQSFVSDPAPLDAGQAGTLTTRTDDDTGVITLGEGHGLTDADTVDVYWAAGVHYGMSITAYDTTTITVDLGAGDVLPTQDTAVVVGVRVIVNCGFDGDNAVAFIADADGRAMVTLEESDDTVIKAIELAAALPYVWQSSSGLTNPLTGEAVGHIYISNGSAAANTVRVLVAYDSA